MVMLVHQAQRPQHIGHWTETVAATPSPTPAAVAAAEAEAEREQQQHMHHPGRATRRRRVSCLLLLLGLLLALPAAASCMFVRCCMCIQILIKYIYIYFCIYIVVYATFIIGRGSDDDVARSVCFESDCDFVLNFFPLRSHPHCIVDFPICISLSFSSLIVTSIRNASFKENFISCLCNWP